MNAYLKKVTDIPWLATDIPSNWEVKRFKDIFVESDEVSKSGKEDLLSVSEYYGVARRKDKMAEEEYESRAESLEGYKICHKGDLVSNIMLTWKKALGVSDFYGIVSPAYAVYKGVNIYPKYYHYLLRSDMYAAEFRRQSKGIIDSRLRLYTDRFYAIKTLYPPIDEQRQIANYLDEKIAAINATIAARNEEMKLLKKFKQSKIAEVVTRGLTPNVPTKSSPLGQIPAHWEVRRTKDVCTSIFTGATPSTTVEEFWDGDIPWIPSGCCHDCFITEAPKYITQAGLENSSTRWIPAGTTVMAITGATCAQLGTLKIDACANQSVVAFMEEKIKLNARYLFYILFALRDSILTNRTGGAQAGIDTGDCMNILICLPPLEEQIGIVSYLNEECEKIDRKCMLIDEQIEKMQLLKRALINEVVTGKRQLA